MPGAVLRLPSVDLHASFAEAMAELEAEGLGGPGDDSRVGREVRCGLWRSPAGFARYVEKVLAASDLTEARAAGSVAETTWWWCAGSIYLGRISVRHWLTPHLLEVAGHIGYDVRPTARRRGHATAMLREVLPHARALGIQRALVTCDVGNVGSRRVIEANGGVLEDERRGKLRYWIDTAG
jgi:predicted acetyltransferase